MIAGAGGSGGEDGGAGKSGGAGSSVSGGRGRPSPRGRLHFWVIQVTELAVAVALVDLSLHVTRAAVLLGAAAILAAISLTAKGPLGIVRLVGRPAHRALAVVVAAGMALAPLVPVLRPSVAGIAILELGAIGLVRVATLVRVAPGAPLPTEPEPSGRRAGRRDRPGALPGPHDGGGPTPADRAARWAGRAASQTSAAVNRAADARGPAAKAHVLRAARTSGRVTGRLAARRRRSAGGPGH